MWRTYSGQAPWNNLATLRHELRKQANILVIDGLDFLRAEFANLLAPEILPAARSSAFPPTAGARRSPLAAIGPVAAAAAGRSITTGV